MNLEVVGTKLTTLAEKVESDKGPMELLGLFLREDSLELWDLVISAPWLAADKRSDYVYVASKLREELTREEMSGLSRIVILEHGGVVLHSFLEHYGGRIGLADGHCVAESGLIIRRAYIIVAKAGSGQPVPQTAKKSPRAKRGSGAKVPGSK